jgi:hypothetical protein
MAAKRSRLSEARKEARELLKRAKSAPVRGGARTKLEKKAGALLRGERVDTLTPAELRARAKTYATSYAERLTKRADELDAERRAKDAARKREKRAQEKRAKQRAKELREPFGVEQEFDEGEGTGELVRRIVEEAKPRAWCLSPVTLTLEIAESNGPKLDEDGEPIECQERTARLDLARLTAAEGGIVADWILESIAAYEDCGSTAPKGAPREYRRSAQAPAPIAGAKPADEQARAQFVGLSDVVTVFVEPFGAPAAE